MPKTLIHFDNNNNRSHRKTLIEDGESLVEAYREYGRPIRTYDDNFGPLWVYSHEYGPTFIVRAQSFESALECVYDEMPSVPSEELFEAYGFDTDEEFQAAMAAAEETGEYPDLTDGYSYQANSGDGTGVVEHGYHEGLEELTPALLSRLKISIVVESDDDETED